MVKFKTPAALKLLREEFLNGFSFFGKRFVNANKILKCIDEIYVLLPEDMLQARKILRENQCDITPNISDCIYENLTELRCLLE